MEEKKNLSSFTYRYVVLNLYDFLSLVEHFEERFNCFCPYNKNNWGPKQHWTLYGK